MFKKKSKLKVEKVFPLKIYFDPETQAPVSIGRQRIKDQKTNQAVVVDFSPFLLLTDRDKNLLPISVPGKQPEVRFVDLVVYEKTKIEG